MSKKWTLNNADWKSIGMGALKVMLGALLTYVSQIISGFDFGMYTPAVMWGLTTLINMGWKFVQGK